jgi:hypothetical protein
MPKINPTLLSKSLEHVTIVPRVLLRRSRGIYALHENRSFSLDRLTFVSFSKSRWKLVFSCSDVIKAYNSKSHVAFSFCFFFFLDETVAFSFSHSQWSKQKLTTHLDRVNCFFAISPLSHRGRYPWRHRRQSAITSQAKEVSRELKEDEYLYSVSATISNAP